MSTPAPATSAAGEWRAGTTVVGGDRVEALFRGSKAVYEHCGPITKQQLKSIAAEINASLAALREQLANARGTAMGNDQLAAELREELTRLDSHCTDVENEKALALKQLATRDAALRQKDEALRLWANYYGPSHQVSCREEFRAIVQKAHDAALAIQPDSALNAVIEAATAPLRDALLAVRSELMRLYGGIPNCFLGSKLGHQVEAALAATAKQDLPTAATLSAGEQPNQETSDV